MAGQDENKKSRLRAFARTRAKKSSFFKIANSQKFFAKISQIRPWVSRIE